MGSIFKTIGISLADSVSTSAFGRLRTAGEGNRFDFEPIYGVSIEDLVDEVIGGTGTVTHNPNPRDLTLATNGTGLTASAGLYGYPVPYTPGNGQEIEMTGVMDMAGIGGGTAEFFLRSSVSGVPVELETIPSTEWANQDIVSTIDWTKSHILAMDFQSLKVGRIRFGLNINGITIPLASIRNDNKYNTGYWQYPQQPAFWNIYNLGSETIMEMGYGDIDNAIGLRYRIPINAGATMKAICGTVKSEGGKAIEDMTSINRGVSMREDTVTVGNSLIPLISIRPKTLFNTFSNRAIAIPKEISVFTDNPIALVITHNNTVTGASWTDVDTNESIMEYDVSGSAITNGHIVNEYFSGGEKNKGNSSGGILGKTLLWNRRGSASGIMTVNAIRTTTTNANVSIGINWGEIR